MGQWIAQIVFGCFGRNDESSCGISRFVEGVVVVASGWLVIAEANTTQSSAADKGLRIDCLNAVGKRNLAQ